MNTKLTLDKAGRLVLPKAIRESLRVGPGDTLEVESDEDRVILHPVRVRAGLSKEQGVWVFRSGTPANTSISKLIEEQRDQRTQDVLESRP